MGTMMVCGYKKLQREPITDNVHTTGNDVVLPQLVSRCFKPNQPQWIISRLKETFIKRYVVERINKAELRPQEQSEKAEGCRENLWNEIQLKGP